MRREKFKVGRIGERKRGATHLDHLLEGIIAAVVLVIVGYGVYLIYTDGAASFLKFLPDFLLNKEKLKDVSILGYDIENANVQYYDGESWRDFPKADKSGQRHIELVELGEKRIEFEEAKQDFRDFYFDVAFRDEVIRSDNVVLKDGLHKTSLIGKGFIQTPDQPSTGGPSWFIFGNLDYKSKGGDLQILLREKNNEDAGLFILRIDKSILFFKNGDTKPSKSMLSNEVRDYYVIWRDRIFEKPIAFIGEEYCVIEIYPRIMIDLNKPSRGKCE